MAQELVDAITEMREDDALAITNRLLDEGVDPMDILEDCRGAMEIIGVRFETGDCFIPELILAGEMLTQISEVIKPRMETEASQETLGKVVIGTVEGDIHDIAKDIVTFMLEINGFEVTDLGVDVSPDRFVEAVKVTSANIVGLSGFLTLAYDPMKETVAALREFDPEVKIMIGGGQVDEQIRQYTAADAYGRDAMAAVALAKGWA
jgi:methanogenic corrinoid protein MtbC1